VGEADNVRLFVNEETKPVFQQAQAAARRKAAEGRERRQVEKLAAAVRYWELSAELFELRAAADRVKSTIRRTLRDLADHSVPSPSEDCGHDAEQAGVLELRLAGRRREPGKTIA
jgi:hypothetical protein